MIVKEDMYLDLKFISLAILTIWPEEFSFSGVEKDSSKLGT